MRYTLSFQLETGATPSQEVDFLIDIDIRKLIPVELRNSRFLLKSSFHTTNLGDAAHGHLGVLLSKIPTAYNKTKPETSAIKIGNARPAICSHPDGSNAAFSYSYSENECIPVIIDYPEISLLEIGIASFAKQNITNNSLVSLTLSFEAI